MYGGDPARYSNNERNAGTAEIKVLRRIAGKHCWTEKEIKTYKKICKIE